MLNRALLLLLPQIIIGNREHGIVIDAVDRWADFMSRPASPPEEKKKKIFGKKKKSRAERKRRAE